MGHPRRARLISDRCTTYVSQKKKIAVLPTYHGGSRTVPASQPHRPPQPPRPLRRLPRITTTSASPPLVALASMDAPPQGYRTNVGICLADPSLTRRVHSLPALLRTDYTRRSTDSLTYLQIFSASRLDIPSAWQMPQVIQSPLRDTRGNNPTHTLQTDWLTTGWYRPGGRSESSCI
jgi:hypothetical protein